MGNDFDKELRDYWDATRTGYGHPLGADVYRQNQEIERGRKQMEADQLKWRLDRQAAEKAANQQAKAANQQAGISPRTVISDPPGATGSSWLDKVVLYTALMLAVVGFGLGFAAASLVGAVVGAAVGFTAPFGLRWALNAAVDIIESILPNLLKLAAIMGLGAIVYFVLLS